MSSTFATPFAVSFEAASSACIAVVIDNVIFRAFLWRCPSDSALFKGLHMTHFFFLSSCWCSCVGIGCGRLRAASITFSPRAPHALILFFFSASQWLWVRLSGSSAAAELHSPGCFAVAWLQASVLRHWLEVRRARHPLAKRAGKNRASIGCRDTAGLLRLARFGGSSHPWRLSLCKHPGCFLQWECVYQQLSFAGVSRLRPSVSEE